MSRYQYAAHYEDSEVTEPSEISRLQLGEFAPNESANLPCTAEQLEELRKLGRLDSDERHLRRERVAALKYQIKDFSNKSSTTDIETRFDADVDRFSNLETGQTATIDAPLTMQLITEAAVRLTPHIGRVLDIGCGAGTFPVVSLVVSPASSSLWGIDLFRS